MNHLKVTRKERKEVSIMVKVECTLFFVTILWFIYQLYKLNQLEEGYKMDDVKALGRRGGVRSSSSNFDIDNNDLYGIDLVGAAERIKHVGKDNEEEDEGNYAEEYLRNKTPEEEENGALNRRSFGEGKTANTSVLKCCFNGLKVVRFEDENGVPKHYENGEVRSLIEENGSSSGNDSREMELC